MGTKQIGGAEMREIATMIKNKIPGLGFALLVFQVECPGMSNYISNCDRGDMIKAMEETLERWKKGQDFPTPERN